MKKNLFNPVIKLYTNNIENTYVALLLDGRDALKILVFNNDFTLSYRVLIDENDIDRTYTFSLKEFREMLSKVKALNQFSIKDNVLTEINKLGNAINRPMNSVIHAIPADNVKTFDISIYTSPEKLVNFKKHERHKVELQEYPELNNLMIRQEENNLLFYSTNGYSILETCIPVSENIMNGQYFASPVLFKNLDLEKLGIKKYKKDIEIGIKNSSSDDDAPSYIAFVINEASMYHDLMLRINLKPSNIKLETIIESQAQNKKNIKLEEQFNVKNLSQFVIKKNKNEAKNNKYRVSFSIRNEYLCDGDEFVMPMPHFPDIKIINGYDLLEILENEITVLENQSLIALCSCNQRLLLKKS